MVYALRSSRVPRPTLQWLPRRLQRTKPASLARRLRQAASSHGTSVSAGAALAAALKKEATENRAPEPAAPAHKKAGKPAVTPAPATTHKTPASLVSASEPPTVERAAKRDEPGPGYDTPIPAAPSRRDFAAAPRPTPQNPTPEALKAGKAAQVLSAGNTSNPPVNAGAAAEAPAPPGEETPAYTGEQISLNLKDVDLKDFFRLVHEISGLNILVDPNVSGSVTMVLDNVPWDQALDIVLKDNGLGKVLEGNVLRIARFDTLMAEQETANKLAAERLRAAPLVTIFRPVNYANANDIMTLFKTWSGNRERTGSESSSGPLSARGTVLVDKRTNTLIISDVASHIPKIEEAIAKLDTKTKQVAIEARIVLANLDLSAHLVGRLGRIVLEYFWFDDWRCADGDGIQHYSPDPGNANVYRSGKRHVGIRRGGDYQLLGALPD